MTEFRKMGMHPVYAPEIKLSDVHAFVESFEGIVINTKIKADRALLERGKRLKFVARLGSGKDIIDLVAADELGIHIITSPEGNRNAVAEHAMGMLLCLANNILTGDQEVRNLHWDREKNRGFELEDKILGIIGFGNTGRAFAEKFENWKTSILSYDKYKKHYATDLRFVTETNLEEIQLKADIISLHLPLTDETLKMVDQEFINKCKEGVIILNTSRGKVVDENAIIDNLKSGKIGGLCMDVFENEHVNTFTQAEKMKYEELFSLRNTVFTPHVAGWTHESKRKIAETIIGF
jgi:D-3-phosphoglycerate dehydrogenase